MANLVEVVEGWTDRLEFTLKADGVAVELPEDVTLNLRDVNGELVNYDDEVEIDPDQTANKGKVYFDPPEGAFLAANGPYRARFRVEDGDGLVVFFPNCKEADLILVGKP